MTTYAQMLELSDPPDAFVRGHGWGSVRVLMAGSLNANPSCWVRLYGSGKMLWVDQSDLRLSHNPGDERDGIDIPEDWRLDIRHKTMTLDNGMVIPRNSSVPDVACTRPGCAVRGSGVACDLPGCPGAV